MIKIYDNIFDQNIQEKIYNEIINLNYLFGERDTPNSSPTGKTSLITEDLFTYQEINKFILTNKFIKNLKIYRSYVNLFLPKEDPFFHIDNENGITLLYYSLPSDNKWNIDEHGETQFYIKEKNEIKGIFPIKGRLILFSSNVLHRATSFRTLKRYTVAFKLI